MVEVKKFSNDLISEYSYNDVVYVLEHNGLEPQSESYDDYRDAVKLFPMNLLNDENKTKITNYIKTYLQIN